MSTEVWAQRSNVTYLLRQILDKYHQEVRPNYDGPPVEVNISMHILDIKVDTKNQEITFEFYFRQSWVDPRLQFNSAHLLDYLTLTTEKSKEIWKPDTFFVNERSAFVHDVTQHNSFTRLYPSGEVKHSCRLTTVIRCPMNLAYYPMDSQSCKLIVESFGWRTIDLVYQWNEGIDGNSVTISKDLYIPHFTLKGFKLDYDYIHLTTGNYSRLVCNFEVQRQPGRSIHYYYLISTFALITSWLGFFINYELYRTFRALLGLIPLVVIFVTMLQAPTEIPGSVSMTALDAYLVFCLVLILLSVIEYLMVIHLKGNATNNENADITSNSIEETPNKASVEESRLIRIKNIFQSKDFDPIIIDMYARYVFPAVFLFFSIIYWASCNSNS